MLPFGSSSFGRLEGSQDYAAAPSQLPCLVFFCQLEGSQDYAAAPSQLPFLFCSQDYAAAPSHGPFLDHKASEDAEARSVESSEVESS